jgi:hypothetical protein
MAADHVALLAELRAAGITWVGQEDLAAVARLLEGMDQHRARQIMNVNEMEPEYRPGIGDPTPVQTAAAELWYARDAARDRSSRQQAELEPDMEIDI